MAQRVRKQLASGLVSMTVLVSMTWSLLTRPENEFFNKRRRGISEESAPPLGGLCEVLPRCEHPSHRDARYQPAVPAAAGYDRLNDAQRLRGRHRRHRLWRVLQRRHPRPHRPVSRRRPQPRPRRHRQLRLRLAPRQPPPLRPRSRRPDSGSQRAFQTGGRFSAKASGPSMASSDRNTRVVSRLDRSQWAVSAVMVPPSAPTATRLLA